MTLYMYMHVHTHTHLLVDLSEVHHLLHCPLGDQSKHFDISTLTNTKGPVYIQKYYFILQEPVQKV